MNSLLEILLVTSILCLYCLDFLLDCCELTAVCVAEEVQETQVPQFTPVHHG